MQITKADIKKIADLACLALHQDEVDKCAIDLPRILSLVDDMNAINIDGIEPLTNGMDLSQRMRRDEVSEEDQREYFQKIAPETDDEGRYLVPQVIEE